MSHRSPAASPCTPHGRLSCSVCFLIFACCTFSRDLERRAPPILRHACVCTCSIPQLQQLQSRAGHGQREQGAHSWSLSDSPYGCCTTAMTYAQPLMLGYQKGLVVSAPRAWRGSRQQTCSTTGRRSGGCPCPRLRAPCRLSAQAARLATVQKVENSCFHDSTRVAIACHVVQPLVHQQCQPC